MEPSMRESGVLGYLYGGFEEGPRVGEEDYFGEQVMTTHYAMKEVFLIRSVFV